MRNKTKSCLAGIVMMLVMLLTLLPSAAFAGNVNVWVRIGGSNSDSPGYGDLANALEDAAQRTTTADRIEIVSETIGQTLGKTLGANDTLQTTMSEPKYTYKAINGAATISVSEQKHVALNSGTIETNGELGVYINESLGLWFAPYGEDGATYKFATISKTLAIESGMVTLESNVGVETDVRFKGGNFSGFSASENGLELTVDNGATVMNCYERNDDDEDNVYSYTGSSVTGVGTDTKVTLCSDDDDDYLVVLTGGKGSSTTAMAVDFGETLGMKCFYVWDNDEADTKFTVDAKNKTLTVPETIVVADELGVLYTNGTFKFGEDGKTITATNTGAIVATRGGYFIKAKTSNITVVVGEEQCQDEHNIPTLTLTSGSGQSIYKMNVAYGTGTKKFTVSEYPIDSASDVNVNTCSTTYTAVVNKNQLWVKEGYTVKDEDGVEFQGTASDDNTFKFEADNKVSVPNGSTVKKDGYVITGDTNAVVEIGESALTLISGKASSTGSMKVTLGGTDKAFTCESTSGSFTVNKADNTLTVPTGVTVKDEKNVVYAEGTYTFGTGNTVSLSEGAAVSYIGYEIIGKSAINNNIPTAVKIGDNKLTLIAGWGDSTKKMDVTYENGVTKSFNVSNGKYTVNAEFNGLTVASGTVTDADTNSARFGTGTFEFNADNTITLWDNATISSKSDGDGASVIGVGNTNKAVVTVTSGNVVLTSGTGKTTGTIVAQLGESTKKFTTTGSTAYEVTANASGTVTLKTNGATVTDEKNLQYKDGEFTFSTNGSIEVSNNATITGTNSNITGVDQAVVKVGDGNVLTLVSGKGKVSGEATVNAKVNDTTVSVTVNANESAEIDITAGTVTGLTETQTVKIGEITYTAASNESAFPLSGVKLSLTGEKATIPNSTTNLAVTIADNKVVYVTATTGDVTVEKTATGSTVQLTKNGDSFKFDEKTYTAGSDGAEFTVNTNNSKVFINTGSATLSGGDSVYGGESLKLIANPANSGSDKITVAVGENMETVTVPGSGKVALNGTEFENASTTDEMTIVVKNGSNQLTAGAVKLDDGEKILGKSGKEIENPANSGGDVITVTADSAANTDSVVVSAYRKVRIGGATYTASYEGVTLKVESNGSVTVTAGSLQTYKRFYNKTTTTTTTTDTTGKKSPTTFDAGVGIYAVSAVLSLTGMAWVGKKKF